MSHPHVTLLTHIPEVLSYKAAKTQTKKHLLAQSSPRWTERYKISVQACLCVFLPANWKLARVVCTDAVVVAVVKVADRRTAIVPSARLGHTLVTVLALQ